jgi:hypothetical protein
MHYQHQHDDVGTVDTGQSMAKTAPEPLLEIELREKTLKNDQSGEGGQVLGLEPHLQGVSCFTAHRRSATFHLKWSPLFVGD